MSAQAHKTTRPTARPAAAPRLAVPACGGGTTVMNPPGWPDARHRTASPVRQARPGLATAGAALLLVALALALSACGSSGGEGSDARRAGSVSAPEFVQMLASQTPRRRVQSVAPGVDTEALLDWAQWKYPALFPPGAATVEIVHQGVAYSVRAYPGGTYLGVSRPGEIWGLGSYTAGRLQSFGPVSAYAAEVQADRCRVYAERCAPATATDVELRALITRHGLTGDPTVGRSLPNIADALPQLGKLLFFSKSLSAGRDTACASCHHPVLGGADGLGVSVGPQAEQPDLVGPGRRRADGQLLVARNANSFFNVALYDRFMFADGRVQSLVAASATPAPNGIGQPMATPDSGSGLADPLADPLAGPNLPAAQARFPITGVAEMRGPELPGLNDAALRTHLASRLAGEAAAQLAGSGWLPHFRAAFGRPDGTAAELITFDHIVQAIAEYQRSAVFVKSPWYRYVRGENTALDEETKRGAIAFLTPAAEGGPGCVQCHQGDFFTNERFHVNGFPQAGPGFAADRSDIGRQRINGVDNDRMAFRTATLLNVEMTAPYGHAGTYGTLLGTVRHYGGPDEAVDAFLSGREWCRLAGYAESADCAGSFSVVSQRSREALAQMKTQRVRDPANALPDITATRSQLRAQRVTAFLLSLTDPCVKDRACLARWIPRPDEAPDAHQLNAVDRNGALR